MSVNGRTLFENAIAVDGTAYVPLRPISESLGTNPAVKGKTIEITTGTPSSYMVVEEQSQAMALKNNPYTNWSKELIVKHFGTVEELIEILNNDITKSEKSLTDIDRRIGAAGDDQKLIERIEKSVTVTKSPLKQRAFTFMRGISIRLPLIIGILTRLLNRNANFATMIINKFNCIALQDRFGFI
ncbi:hypothetical protein [Paenibacillus polymyxa]|uniref:hypothetical protein n=1 Tax=Paenibacillus TaxID=44249 RepID=UPI000737CA33|nr:hypothetical protein [Paenibacillus polymyxa]